MPPPLYSPYVLYWTGMLQVSYVAVSSLPVLFLSVDRCLTLNVPLGRYRRWVEPKIVPVGAVALIVFYVISMAIGLMEIPLQWDKGEPD